MGVVERRSVPGPFRVIDPLTDPDHTDAFGAAPSSAKLPQEWARATSDEAPVAMHWFPPASWRAAHGLRLGLRYAPDHVQVASEVSETAASVTSQRAGRP